MKHLINPLIKAYMLFLAALSGIFFDGAVDLINAGSLDYFSIAIGLTMAALWMFAAWSFLSVVQPQQVVIGKSEYDGLMPIRYTGFVYVMHRRDGLYKIGRTNNIDRRLHEVSKKLRERVSLICAFRVFDPALSELELHNQFKEKRVKGEWFSLSQEDIDYIKGLAG